VNQLTVRRSAYVAKVRRARFALHHLGILPLAFAAWVAGVNAKMNENTKMGAERLTRQTAYVDWLLDRHVTSEKRILRYAGWLERFLHFRGMRPRTGVAGFPPGLPA
jgi:hypothetical protein